MRFLTVGKIKTYCFRDTYNHFMLHNYPPQMWVLILSLMA